MFKQSLMPMHLLFNFKITSDNMVSHESLEKVMKWDKVKKVWKALAWLKSVLLHFGSILGCNEFSSRQVWLTL